jgi:hypothetical protein
MPRVFYVPKAFSPGSLELIERANTICAAYAAQGYDLTLRQLYYQFVARGWIANKDSEYKRLGAIVNDARLAGLIDWRHVVDRTRNLRSLSHWTSPAEIVQGAAYSFRTDLWASQPYRPEVWVEKDALIGVIARVCEREDVAYFSCRGYTSQSELWGAAQRLERSAAAGQVPVIVHLGDHDPSGIDMTRDIAARLELFMRSDGYEPAEVRRIALNMGQVERYQPPPNPAKVTDSRSSGYIARFDASSWELDALNPEVLDALIGDEIAALRDLGLWEAGHAAQERARAVLTAASRRWGEVAGFLDGGGDAP